jgi:hypothetical protein
MRKKWLDKVEFIEKSIPEDGIRKKIVMFNGGNGDLYLTVCPETHNGGITIRIERSGGAITSNPRLVHTLGLAYDAIAGNEDTLLIKNLSKEPMINPMKLIDITKEIHNEFITNFPIYSEWLYGGIYNIEEFNNNQIIITINNISLKDGIYKNLPLKIILNLNDFSYKNFN